MKKAIEFVTKHRFGVVTGLAAGSCFLVGLVGSTQLPKVRSWILVKIEETSRDHLPVRILPRAVDVSFFPLGASLEGVRIVPKPETAEVLDAAIIEKLEVSVSPWQLLNGKLRLTDVWIDGANVIATIPKTEKKAGPPLAGAFDILAKIPVNHIELKRISATLTLSEPQARVEINDLAIDVEKRRGNTVAMKLDSAAVQIHKSDEPSSVRLELEGEVQASRTSVAIKEFKLRRGESYATLTANLNGDTEALKFSEIEGKTEADIQLESMRNWAVKSFPKHFEKMPQLKGHAFIAGKIGRKGSRDFDADLEARAEGLKVDKMFFDRVEAKGTYHADQLKLTKAVVDNPAGTLSLSDTVLNVGDTTSISTKLSVPALQVHELLKHLGVGEVPVWLRVSGELPCSGTFKPEFLLTCKGRARGENLLVRAGMKEKGTIAAIKEFNAEGEVTINAEEVTYKTELAMPNSKGRSSGAIGYETGFKIDYQADTLALKDIANLSDLKLEGSARIKGSTQGDSDAGTIQMDVDGTDIWFEDWWLGNAKATATYKKGILGFSGVQGNYTVSRYTGDVRVDIPNSEINFTGRVPFFDMKDGLKAVSRKVTLPFPVTGTGQAQIKVSGPIGDKGISVLSYDLKSSIFRGSAAGETFDQAHFDVKSVNGEVKAERVQVSKGTGLITLTGVGHPDGTVKTMILGRNIKVEDTNAVANSGLALSGLVDFDMDMSGPVLHPNTDMRGKLSKTSIGDQGVPDSSFNLRFSSATIEGAGTFLGDVVKANFVLPLSPTSPFSLKLQTQEWNYAPIFAAIAGPGGRKDYEGKLTSNITLDSASGGFWNATGQAKIDQFSLSRGALALKAPEPLMLNMKNGQVHVQKFDLEGENVFLKVTEVPHPSSKLDLQVNGKLDMTLLALVMPFFEDLRGVLSFAFNVKAGPGNAGVLGSAYLEKGFVKFFDFPHPIEDISIDLLFNHSKLLFNTVKADFGGGRVTGSGGMELKGYKNYPVNLAATFDKITVNIPEGVRTTGSGNLSFTGNWFPFNLKVDYEVREGMITKEFGGGSDDNDSGGIRRDYFLPEVLLQEQFVPVTVDAQINFPRGIGIKNELMEGRLIGALSVKGNPAKPSILGTVTTDSETKINFRDTVFEVSDANFQFLDANEINPKLFISARSRVNEYDVNLLVQGNAMPKPLITLSSVPPLAEKEIISLLALGATDQQLDSKVKSSEQGTSVGGQVGTTALKDNPLSKKIKETIGFDVQFSTGFDDTTNSSVQKVIVSRKITQKLNVSATQSLGKGRDTEAKARYRLNDRFSLIGSWAVKDYTEGNQESKSEYEPNKFGLDVEYKFEFK